MEKDTTRERKRERVGGGGEVKLSKKKMKFLGNGP